MQVCKKVQERKAVLLFYCVFAVVVVAAAACGCWKIKEYPCVSALDQVIMWKEQEFVWIDSNSILDQLPRTWLRVVVYHRHTANVYLPPCRQSEIDQPLNEVKGIRK